MAESIPQKRLMLLGEGEEKSQNETYTAAKRQKGFSDAWEKEPPLALPAKKQRENDLCEQKKEKEAPLNAESNDWEKVYSFEEKRLKSLIIDGEGYEKWENNNRLWEVENGLIPKLEDWEKEYSFEEKRLKSLSDEDGFYFRWEKQNWLWERENHRVPEEEELSEEEEMKRDMLRYALSLSPVSLQDPIKAKEGFDKKIELLRTKDPLTEEEKKLKELYLDKTANWYAGCTKESLVPYLPGWDRPNRPKLPTVQLPDSEESEAVLYLFRKRQPAPPAPVISQEERREILAAEGRCFDGSYITPYCKCNRNHYQFDTALEGAPPECLPIWLAYCRQYRQSHCFDIDDYIGGRVEPLPPFEDFDGNAELLMELANLAIKDYNEKECNVFKYKVLKIEKVICAGYHTYWMTVKVSNITLGTPIETFQIHAGKLFCNNENIIFCCRPKEEAIIGLPSCEFCFGLLPETPVMEGKEP